MPEVTLLVNGQLYGGWTSVSVTRSVEQIAGTFDLSLTERWPGQQQLRGIVPGDACAVRIDGEIVITGYVDEVKPSYDSGSHDVSVSGRDATGDLVDSSAVNSPGEWLDQTIGPIASAIAGLFKIPVRVAVDTGVPFDKFRLEEGESAFEAIERMCRMRSILPMSDGQGGLILGRAGGGGRAQVRLQRGLNILTASATISMKDRHSDYLVKSQLPSDDMVPVDQTSRVQAVAHDPSVKRHRPLIIIAEQSSDNSIAQSRALWEANVRAARSRRVEVSVFGWREAGADSSPLWAPNRLVRITDDWLGVDQDLLISGVTLSKSESGTITRLSLIPPGAFEVEPKKQPWESVVWRD